MNINSDVLFCVFKYIFTKDILNFVQVDKKTYNHTPFWQSVLTRHKFTIPSDRTLSVQETALNYLNSPQQFTILTVDQSPKTLVLRKYLILAYPETPLKNIAGSIYSRLSEHKEKCEVTLQVRGRNSLVDISSIKRVSNDKVQSFPSVEVPEITAYSWKTLFSDSLLSIASPTKLQVSDPKGGPFGIYDTNKNLETWTWEKCDIKKHFENINKTSLDVPLGIFRNATIILNGPHVPEPEMVDDSFSYSY